VLNKRIGLVVFLPQHQHKLEHRNDRVATENTEQLKLLKYSSNLKMSNEHNDICDTNCK